MKWITASASILIATIAPAFAGTAAPQLPEPATMGLFGLAVGGAYVAKRFLRRK